MNNMDNTYEPTEDKTQEKIKVESIDTIVTMHGDKPYYENKYRKVGDKCYHIGYSSYYLDVALEYRKKYFEVVERESDWIPCSERMPEDNTDVIVCFYSGTVTEMRYWGDGIFQGIYEHTAKTIVAWMPLPEPYKGE
mgnify:FL=1